MAQFFYEGEGDPAQSRGGLVVFGRLGPNDWQRLRAHLERRRFKAGDVVIAAGTTDRSLYLVASGSLEIVVGDGRHQRRVREQGAGTILGEVAFFDGLPRSATVRAITPCEVLRLSPDAFEVLAARHPDLGRQILLELGRVLAVRLRHAESRDGG
jgi:CRP-like cAMP-binding protein